MSKSEWLEHLVMALAIAAALYGVRRYTGHRFESESEPERETAQAQQQVTLPGGFVSPPWLA